MTHTRNKKNTCGTVAVLVTLTILVAVGALAWAATGTSIAPYQTGETALFEDHSYIVTVANRSYGGCIPFGLCSEIGIDSPWEDYLPKPLDSLAYWLVDMFIKPFTSA